MNFTFNEATQALYRQLIAKIQALKEELAEAEIELARLQDLLDPPSNSSDGPEYYWNDKF